MASSHPPKTPNADNTPASQPSVCDYEGSTYRTDFWTQDRTYEDAVERVALQALLPTYGRHLVEIGAGYGRLVDLYAGYEQVILFDYSRSLLREARSQWGDTGPTGQPRYLYVAGDFNALPFVPGRFDTVTMIRVLHHAPDAPHVLRGISEIIGQGGTFVLEFANKRNFKAIARWLLRRQEWSPFDPEPYEFVELNFDFHPHWVQAHLKGEGFDIQNQRSVSHFRLGWLKRLVPTRHLVRLDSMAQPTGRWWQLSPSIFVKSRAPQAKPSAEAGALFRCPVCRSCDLNAQPEALVCNTCHRAWPTHNGLHDFKESL